MQNPFNSDYLHSSGTEASVNPNDANSTAITANIVKAPTPQAKQENNFDFQVDQYAQGKPRRIVVRGKIARD